MDTGQYRKKCDTENEKDGEFDERKKRILKAKKRKKSFPHCDEIQVFLFQTRFSFSADVDTIFIFFFSHTTE